jgi:hypothetical protein
MSDPGYHSTRFAYDPRREALWKTLCRAYFDALIPASGTVLELGAGYAHFINNVRAQRRIALDLWPGFTEYVAPDVQARVGSAAELGFLEDSCIDFVFASNLFEHLTQPEFREVLAGLDRVMAPGATLAILQPNYHYAYRQYFDDYTHVSVYSHVSLCDFLESAGYTIRACHPRFMPLSVKSRLPVHPFLIRLYLMSPWKPMGGQMLVLASSKAKQGSST